MKNPAGSGKVIRNTIGGFLLVAAVYWIERGRNPGWGDSLGFLVSAQQGFSWSVNATGHFLYNLINVLLLRLLPSADPVILLTAASILFALLALLQVYRTALLITGHNSASLAGMLILAFSFTFWRQAVSIEVYPLFLALIASFFRDVTEDTLNHECRHPDRIGIIFGLALLVHIQAVLLLPAFAAWSVSCRRIRPAGIKRAVLWISAAFLLLIVPAAILPNLTIASVFVDFHFRNAVFAFSPHNLITGFLRSIAYALYNFHLFIPVIIYGAVRIYRNHRPLFILYALTVGAIWAFAFRYPISDNYVFFLTAYLVLALACAAGFSVLFRQMSISRRGFAAVLAVSIILSPALYGTATYATGLIPAVGHRFDRVGYKGGAAYYLWPGRRNTPDPLAFVRQQYHGGQLPSGVDSTAWGNLYPLAVTYLQNKGELP